MNRFVATALCVVALALSGCSHRVIANGAADGGDIVILYENDVHCSVDGYAKIAALKKEMEQYYGNVALVSCGDFIQGGSLGAASKGMDIVGIMNAAGYDVVTLGNHEFDYGMERLSQVRESLDAAVVDCNLIDLRTGKGVEKPYVILKFGRKRVAFIGVSTPYSFVSSTPTFFQDDEGNYIYSLCGDNIYDTVQETVDEARSKGVDFVVAMTHLGDDLKSDPVNSHTLAANTYGIDVILDGHSHSTVEKRILKNAKGEQVVMTSTGAYLRNMGRLVLRPDGAIETELIKTEDYVPESSSVRSVIDSVRAAYAVKGNRVVGYLDEDLTAILPNGYRPVRYQPMPIGELCAEAYRRAGNAQVGIAGGGGIRNNLLAGPVTFNEIYSVLPFENTVCTAGMTGRQIVDMLELSVSNLPDDYGGYLQVSGLSFDTDVSVNTPVVLDDHRAFVRIDVGGRRISNVRVKNWETGEYEPIEEESVYVVAGNNYTMKSGGDGYTLFKDVEVHDTGILDTEALERVLSE